MLLGPALLPSAATCESLDGVAAAYSIPYLNLSPPSVGGGDEGGGGFFSGRRSAGDYGEIFGRYFRPPFLPPPC